MSCGPNFGQGDFIQAGSIPCPLNRYAHMVQLVVIIAVNLYIIIFMLVQSVLAVRRPHVLANTVGELLRQDPGVRVAFKMLLLSVLIIVWASVKLSLGALNVGVGDNVVVTFLVVPIPALLQYNQQLVEQAWRRTLLRMSNDNDNINLADSRVEAVALVMSKMPQHRNKALSLAKPSVWHNRVRSFVILLSGGLYLGFLFVDTLMLQMVWMAVCQFVFLVSVWYRIYLTNIFGKALIESLQLVAEAKMRALQQKRNRHMTVNRLNAGGPPVNSVAGSSFHADQNVSWKSDIDINVMKKSPPEVEHDVSKKRMNSLVSTAPHALNSSIDFQPNFHITDQVVEQNAEAEVKHMPSMISQAQWAPDSQIPFESVVESPPGLASPVLRPSRRQFVSRVSNAKDNSGLDANVPFQQGVLTPPTHAVSEQDAPSTWGLDVNVQFDDSAIIVDGVASPVLSQNGGVITSVTQSQANVASVARGSFKLDADVEFRPGVAVVQSRTARISRKPLPSLVDQHNTSSIIATHGQSQGQRAQGLATLDECTPIVPILEEFKVERKVDAYSPPARLYTDEDTAKRYEVLQASIAQVLIMTKWALVVSTVLFLLIFVPEVCSRASYWLISFFMILAPLQLFFGTWSLYDMTQRLNPRPVINGLLLQNSTRSAPSQQ